MGKHDYDTHRICAQCKKKKELSEKNFMKNRVGGHYRGICLECDHANGNW